MPEPPPPREDGLTTPKLRRIEAETERLIREAIEAGEFRDLAGEGRPVDLGGDEAGDRWAAHRVMRNASFVPEWSALRQEIDEERERLIRVARAHMAWLAARRAARADLPAERILDQSRVTAERDAAFRAQLSDAVGELNARIARYNALVPVANLQLVPARSERLFELAHGADD